VQYALLAAHPIPLTLQSFVQLNDLWFPEA